MNTKYLHLLQKNIANGSVVASTARGMGPKGTVEAARAHFREFDLASMRAESERDYRERLERATRGVMAALPDDARHWGSARKFLNIFLRSSFYNRYLCDAFELAGIEPWMEVPLDSHVGTGLRLQPGGDALPPWKTVIGLTPNTSRKYQDFALAVAKRQKTHRVHLDLLFFRGAHTRPKA